MPCRNIYTHTHNLASILFIYIAFNAYRFLQPTLFWFCQWSSAREILLLLLNALHSIAAMYIYKNICICGVGFSTTLCHSCCLYIKSGNMVPFYSDIFHHWFEWLRNSYVRFRYMYVQVWFLWKPNRSACDVSPFNRYEI